MAKKVGEAPKAALIVGLLASTAAVEAVFGAPVSCATAWPAEAKASAASPITVLALALWTPLTEPVALAEAAVTNCPAASEVLAAALNVPLVPVVTALASACAASVT